MTGYYDKCSGCAALILVSDEWKTDASLPCPQCGTTVPISGAAVQTTCDGCQQPVAAAASLRGGIVVCPNCLRELTMPVKTAAARAATPSAPPITTKVAPPIEAAPLTESASDDLPPVRAKIRLKEFGAEEAAANLVQEASPVEPTGSTSQPQALKLPFRKLLWIGLGVVVIAGVGLAIGIFADVRRQSAEAQNAAIQPHQDAPARAGKAERRKPVRPAKTASPVAPTTTPSLSEAEIAALRAKLQAQLDSQYPLFEVGQNIAIWTKGGVGHNGLLNKLQGDSVLLKIQYGEIEVRLAELKDESRLRLDAAYRQQRLETQFQQTLQQGVAPASR